MTPTLKKKLLARINAGMDSDSACAELGIPVSDLHNASKRFADQIAEAERAGGARLRGRLFKNALSENDTKFLQDLLDRRAQAVANEPITKIERVIINPPCWKCGAVQPLPSTGLPRKKPGKPTNGAARD